MGKPTGFMEYQRKTGNTVAPLERIKNFKEFHLQLPKKEQQMQSASFDLTQWPPQDWPTS